jgi:hypothetical protein
VQIYPPSYQPITAAAYYCNGPPSVIPS